MQNISKCAIINVRKEGYDMNLGKYIQMSEEEKRDEVKKQKCNH